MIHAERMPQDGTIRTTLAGDSGDIAEEVSAVAAVVAVNIERCKAQRGEKITAEEVLATITKMAQMQLDAQRRSSIPVS